MANEKIALTAHLFRRAGFGAAREELECQAQRPYEEVFDDRRDRPVSPARPARDTWPRPARRETRRVRRRGFRRV